MSEIVYIRDSGILAPADRVVASTKVKLRIEYKAESIEGQVYVQNQMYLIMTQIVNVLGQEYILPSGTTALVSDDRVPLEQSAVFGQMEEGDQELVKKVLSSIRKRYSAYLVAARSTPEGLGATDQAEIEKAMLRHQARVNERQERVAVKVKKVSNIIQEYITWLGSKEDDDAGVSLPELLTELTEEGFDTPALRETILSAVRADTIGVLEAVQLPTWEVSSSEDDNGMSDFTPPYNEQGFDEEDDDVDDDDDDDSADLTIEAERQSEVVHPIG